MELMIMKKIITSISLLLVALLCCVSLTACNEPTYTIKDCFDVVQNIEDIKPCSIDDVLGNEPTNFQRGNYSLKTKKALKITKISYTNHRKQMVIENDPLILKEYKVNETVDFSHLSFEDCPLYMHNLVIEFKVL